MNKQKVIICTGLLLSVALSGLTSCSVMGKVGKSVRNITSMGASRDVAVDEKLIIPPSLQNPNQVRTTAKTRRTHSAQRKAPTRSGFVSKKNYFIVVGTYPDQGQALDTFVRLSSIGLSGATMESRTTKSGKNLHMVRLGPYHNQTDIDEAKDSLTSDGLSQFKVVEN